jgi:hypothetical protein
MRPLVFSFVGAATGIVIGFFAVAGTVVALRLGGEMAGVAALDLGLLFGAPLGGVTFALLGVWLSGTNWLRHG